MGNQPASNKATKQAVQRQIVRSQEQNPANKTNALYIVQPPQNAQIQGQQPGEIQQPKSLMDVTEDMIRSCFKSSCINGSLNKEKFNESLSICEEIGLKRMKDTPLGLRLFNIFDLAKDGTVNEEEFVVGLRGLMKEKQKREEYTFKAYDTDQDGQINKEELLYIMSQSWLSAFRILADKFQTKAKTSQFPFEIPSRAQIEQFAQSRLPDFRQAVLKDFNKYDVQKRGYLDQSAFRNWIQEDKTIVVELAGINVQVAVSFLHIEAPPLYPKI